jgi:hypothetical protein
MATILKITSLEVSSWLISINRESLELGRPFSHAVEIDLQFGSESRLPGPVNAVMMTIHQQSQMNLPRRNITCLIETFLLTQIR